MDAGVDTALSRWSTGDATDDGPIPALCPELVVVTGVVVWLLPDAPTLPTSPNGPPKNMCAAVSDDALLSDPKATCCCCWCWCCCCCAAEEEDGDGDAAADELDAAPAAEGDPDASSPTPQNVKRGG
jgi:hypothetical protein